MKKYYKPYNFDYNYEKRTYSNIGKDYGDKNTANKGMLLNLERDRRKKGNKNNIRYKRCDTYTEWKTYLTKKYQNGLNIDFEKYLNMRKNQIKRNCDIVKTIVLPIEVAFLTLIFNAENNIFNIVGVFFAEMFCCLFFGIRLHNLELEKDFLEDSIDVLF